ncbi:MAG: NADH-quinone oxidoreductase subunit K [Chloroflexi bacterium]|nr:NADH-quinone oxidoreductase subunit K [Chloroflexota bacterium]
MEIILILLAGGMFSAGFYLLLQKRLAQLIVGLGLLTNATNLLIFTVAGLSRDGVPLIEVGASTLPESASDPTPQALVLTAIVIGFGVLAFFITLAYRAYREVGSDNLDDMTSTDLLIADGGTVARRDITPKPVREGYPETNVGL